MAPEPEEVGLGDQETPMRLKKLSARLGTAIDEAANGEKLQMVGLVLEPIKGTVHPVVVKGEMYYALGGLGLKDRFPINQATTPQPEINWGGKTGVTKYDKINPTEGEFVGDDNTLGIAFKKPAGRPESRQYLITFAVGNNAPVGEQTTSVLEQFLSDTTGQRPEMLDNITKGLDKAGMAKKESNPATIADLPTEVS